jgi:hypothetical protein
MVDVIAVLGELVGCDASLVVEAEQDPEKANPWVMRPSDGKM